MTQTAGAHIATAGKHPFPHHGQRLRHARRLTPSIAAFLALALLGNALPSWGVGSNTPDSGAVASAQSSGAEGNNTNVTTTPLVPQDAAQAGQPSTDDPGEHSQLPGTTLQSQPETALDSGATQPQMPSIEGATNDVTNGDTAQAGEQPQSIDNASSPNAETPQPNTTPRGHAGFRRATNTDPIPAVFATGGAGRFKDSIQWLQWNNPDLYRDGASLDTGSGPHDPAYVAIGSPGDPQNYRTEHTVTNSRDLGEIGQLITTCTLSNLKQLTRPRQKPGPLVMTIPGLWIGTAFDNLYNVGGAKGIAKFRGVEVDHPGNGADQENLPNRMVVGLATGVTEKGNYGRGNTVEFDLACTAELVSGNTRRNVPINDLVFADAESSSGDGTLNSSEWVSAKVDSNVTWRVLDRIVNPGCTPGFSQKAIRTRADGKQTVTLVPTKAECNAGLGSPIGVMLMEGTNRATIGMQGAGLSTVALGLVLNTDYGDAPRSYGTASALYNPAWSGGAVLQGTDESDLFQPELANLAGAKNRLGLTTTHEREAQLGDAATENLAQGDGGPIGNPGADDAITNADDLKIVTSTGGTLSRTVRCQGNGPVKGWIDWDANGSFQEATEASTQVNCAGGSATLRWTIPAQTKRAVPGETGTNFKTYMRLRTANPGETLLPTGTTLGGEVEDYRVSVYQPTLQLIKQVTRDSYDPTPEPATRWTLKAQQEGATDPARNINGAGGTPISTVVTGVFSLSEEAGDPAAREGYEAGQWQCAETPGTIRPAGHNFTSTLQGNQLTLRGYDRVTCTIVNSPKPGKLRWVKVGQDGTTPVEGAVWHLTGPSHQSGLRVTDCVAASATQCAGPDKDHRPGHYEIGELIWGDYTMTEEEAPTGYDALTQTLRFETITARHLTAQPRDLANTVTAGKIRNARATGTVTWTKTDNRGNLLSGSAWRITEPGGATHSIEDCVSTPCPSAPYRDQNPTAGEFAVKGLVWDDQNYSLEETQAPVGYVRSQTTYPFALTRNKLLHAFDPIVNEKTAVPAIPFTGGMSADSFLIAGAAAAAIAGGAGLASRLQRARQKARR